MKQNILICLLLAPILSFGQSSNIFWESSFWKTAPDVATVQAKMEEGHDPVILTPNAFNGVVYAILNHAPAATIKYLLDLENNDVNKATHDGRNYLMWAAYRGNVEIMEYLITKDSDTDIVDDHGYTVMTFAANGGNKNMDVYETLFANGTKVDDATRSGANALLLLAPHLEDLSLISYFQSRGLDIHAKDKAGNGIFNYAVRKGNMKMLKHLIDMGVDYKGLNIDGENAMIYASMGSRGYTNPVSVYAFLESLGIETNSVTAKGQTPLHHIAARTEDAEIIDYFLEKGVNVNQIDNQGNTAFLNAVRANKLRTAQKLLPLVDDINHTNKDGYSALSYAVTSRSKEAFDFLLSKGADIRVKDKKGRNLVFHTFNSYNTRDEKAFYHFIAKAEDSDLALNETHEGGNTLLHLAVRQDQTFLVEQALKLGANINQKNEEGMTALHMAAMQAKGKRVLSLLLEKGADKSILTDFEESAFDLANENEVLAQKGTDLEFLKISNSSAHK